MGMDVSSSRTAPPAARTDPITPNSAASQNEDFKNLMSGFLFESNAPGESKPQFPDRFPSGMCRTNADIPVQ
jgi:hypothetical protein